MWQYLIRKEGHLCLDKRLLRDFYCWVWEACVFVFHNTVNYLWKQLMVKFGCEHIPSRLAFPSYRNKEVYNKENLFNSLNYDVAAKKRKKDMLNSKTKTQCKLFVLNLRRNCLKIVMTGSLQGKIITPHMLDICFSVYCATDRGYWDLCARKPGCAFYEHKINVFLIVLFISQLLVGVFFFPACHLHLAQLI